MFGPGLWALCTPRSLERGEHSVRSVRGYTSPPTELMGGDDGFLKTPIGRGGGDLRSAISAIYRNFTAILPQFFSDASFKNFIFPLRKILSYLRCR